MKLSINDLDRAYNAFDFSALENKLSESGRPIFFSKGMVVQPKQEEIIVISDGIVIACDEAFDAQNIGCLPRFYPIGIVERDYPSISLYYRIESEVQAFVLSWEEFDQIFHSSLEISGLLHKILANTIAQLVQLYYERNADNSYTTIRNMLYRYMERSQDMRLMNESIASFILSRTRLSRSYVFRILSELKRGEYITVENGKLQSINKDIPTKY